jgi:hypothetical protein
MVVWLGIDKRGLEIEAMEASGGGGNMKRRKSPQLSEKEWPELRRLKAEAKGAKQDGLELLCILG